MTAAEIKLAYALNRQRRRKPGSQYQHAAMLRVPRSMVCTAIKTPTRYPGLRRRIERRLAAVVGSVEPKQNGRPTVEASRTA